MPARKKITPARINERVSIGEILEFLSKIMSTLKISSKQLAADLGCSIQTVNNWRWRFGKQSPGREEWRIKIRARILSSCELQDIDLRRLIDELRYADKERLAEEKRTAATEEARKREEERVRAAGKTMSEISPLPALHPALKPFVDGFKRFTDAGYSDFVISPQELAAKQSDDFWQRIRRPFMLTLAQQAGFRVEGEKIYLGPLQRNVGSDSGSLLGL